VRADQVNVNVPRALGDIIFKLLAKNAEDRYQSSEGLIADLMTCKNCTTKTTDAGQEVYPEEFVAGAMDLYSRFVLPQKLYGREAEVERLLAAFDRVSNRGSCEAVMVRGYSGIGKSSIVQEVQKPIIRKGGGCFISGKFDLFRRGSSSLVLAFRDLLRHLLSEGREAVDIWKAKVMEVVGTNGQLLTEMLPELEKIIGKQPAVPELGPAETENRFNRVFTQFVRLFARKEHPLALFLDDLQWVDAASLQLLSLCMSDSQMQYLLVIGAYRDNEVPSVHPLAVTIKHLERNIPITDIEVLPLSLHHIMNLVRDATRCDEQQATRLSELLDLKTAGNPFYVSQLLKTLHMEGHIWFYFEQGTWCWDCDQLQEQMSFSDNVVDLMVRQIRKLDDEAQHIIKAAAAVGDKFSLQVLAIAAGKDMRETARDLWQVLRAGLVLPMSQSYKFFVSYSGKPTERDQELIEKMEELASSCTYRFLHDRVEQAAYSLIPAEAQEQLHLTIGRRLLHKMSKAQVEENLFSIVTQVNAGARLMTDTTEREQMAILNMHAGKKARVATAYQTAVKHLNYAVALIADPEDAETLYPDDTERAERVTVMRAQEGSCWTDDRRATSMAIFNEAVRVHFLYADFDRADTLCTLMLRHATNMLETLAVQEQRLLFLSNRNMLADAIDLGRGALKLLEVGLVTEPPRLTFTEEQVSCQPDMTDPRLLAAMRILTALFAPAIIRDYVFYAQIAYTMVDLSNRYGTCALSAFGFVSFATVSIQSDAHLGLAAGKLAMRLLDKYRAPEVTPKVYALFYGMIAIWHMPLRSSLEPLAYAKKSGVEVGDHEWAAHCEGLLIEISIFSGESLDIVYPAIEVHYNATVARGHTMQAIFCNFWRRFALKMSHEDYPESYSFFGRAVTDELMVQEQVGAKEVLFSLVGLLSKGIFLYYQKKFVESSVALRTATTLITGTMLNRIHVRYYASLALLQVARLEKIGSKEFQDIIDEVKEHQRVVLEFANDAPMNYMHKYQLVEAEKWNVLGKHSKAMDLYESAIDGAVRNMFMMDEALSKELAAEFYCTRNKPRFAAGYLRDAYYAFMRWGQRPR
jgi:predicted ATPase